MQEVEAIDLASAGPLTVIKALPPLACLFTVANSELAAPTLGCPQIWRPHHWYMQLITFKWLFKRPGARLWNSSLILVTCLRGLWVGDLSCLRQGDGNKAPFPPPVLGSAPLCYVGMESAYTSLPLFLLEKIRLREPLKLTAFLFLFFLAAITAVAVTFVLYIQCFDLTLDLTHVHQCRLIWGWVYRWHIDKSDCVMLPVLKCQCVWLNASGRVVFGHGSEWGGRPQRLWWRHPR